MLPQKFSAATTRIVREAAPPTPPVEPEDVGSLVAPQPVVPASTPTAAVTRTAPRHLCTIDPLLQRLMLMRADIKYRGQVGCSPGTCQARRGCSRAGVTGRFGTAELPRRFSTAELLRRFSTAELPAAPAVRR